MSKKHASDQIPVLKKNCLTSLTNTTWASQFSWTFQEPLTQILFWAAHTLFFLDLWGLSLMQHSSGVTLPYTLPSEYVNLTHAIYPNLNLILMEHDNSDFRALGLAKLSSQWIL